MKFTVAEIIQRKTSGQPIAMLTVYDAQTATLLEAAGIDLLLVGDTLGIVFQGQGTTRAVTIDHMLYHVEVVRRGAPNTFLIGDLPYGTYDTPETGLRAAHRLAGAGADAVKLEGNPPGVIAAIVADGIPVMAHLGLQPQTAESFRVRGKREDEAAEITRDALSVAAAGAFSLVLESVPEGLGRIITRQLSIPTIGIGAGNQCDGQVLVINDMLGLTTTHIPKFVKRFADLAAIVRSAVERYVVDVRDRSFPSDEQTYH